MKSSTICTVKLISFIYFSLLKKRKTVCDQFLTLLRDYFTPIRKMIVSQPRKLVTQSFTFFKNKMYIIKISFTMQLVELFKVHLMIYLIFCNKTFLGIKIWNAKCCPLMSAIAVKGLIFMNKSHFRIFGCQIRRGWKSRETKSTSWPIAELEF